MGHHGGIELDIEKPGDTARTLEIEAAIQIGTMDRYLAYRLDVSIAVHIVQVSHIHGVLRRFLGMTRKLETVKCHAAPIVSRGRILGQSPLNRSAVDPPPGEYQAEHFLGLEHPEFGDSGRWRMGCGDALAGGVELESVERTDEAAVAHRPAAGRTEIGAHVWTYRLGHAHASVTVAPGDDVHPHPGFRYQLVLEDRLVACNEVPPLGIGKQCGFVVPNRTARLHCAGLLSADDCGGPFP